MRTMNRQASSKIKAVAPSEIYARIVETPNDVVITKAKDLLVGDVVLVPSVGRRAVRNIGDVLVFTMPRSGEQTGKIAKTKSFKRVGFVQGGWSPIPLAERVAPKVKAVKATKLEDVVCYDEVMSPKAHKALVASKKGKKASPKVNENEAIVKALRASMVVVGQAADLLERLG